MRPEDPEKPLGFRGGRPCHETRVLRESAVRGEWIGSTPCFRPPNSVLDLLPCSTKVKLRAQSDCRVVNAPLDARDSLLTVSLSRAHPVTNRSKTRHPRSQATKQQTAHDAPVP